MMYILTKFNKSISNQSFLLVGQDLVYGPTDQHWQRNIFFEDRHYYQRICFNENNLLHIIYLLIY